jgi:hypothetical protein
MRFFVAFLIILAVLYFWDVEYNHGTLSDGLSAMGLSFTAWGISRQALTGGFRAGQTLPLNHRHNLEDKAVNEIVDADPRLGARKIHHSKACSAAVRCL